MKDIPTAKEFLEGNNENEPWTGSVENALIEFAKMHVKLALEKASNEAIADINEIESDDTIPPTVIHREVYIIKASILEAYPLTNIK